MYYLMHRHYGTIEAPWLPAGRPQLWNPDFYLGLPEEVQAEPAVDLEEPVQHFLYRHQRMVASGELSAWHRRTALLRIQWAEAWLEEIEAILAVQVQGPVVGGLLMAIPVGPVD
jgi:hypothetical protein